MFALDDEDPHMPAFKRYIGIDYSGATTPNSGLKGLRVYAATVTGQAVEVLPPPGARKYWTRQGVAHWLADRLSEDIPTLVGIDHGFSFPLQYFEKYRLPLDWRSFLDDFQRYWPTDLNDIYVDFIREGMVGDGKNRMGDARWRRVCEIRCRAKSVFHFDVQGSVAKSTHAGLPWLRYLSRQLDTKVHFWPFDGWDIVNHRSAVLEAYPALYKHGYSVENRSPDQHDAYAIASWLRDRDQLGGLLDALHPALSKDERKMAEVEGWILGVA